MSFKPKVNTGQLFKNKYKVKPNHPDMTGKLYLEKSLIEKLLKEQHDGWIEVEASAYKTTSKEGMTYLSMMLKEPFQSTNTVEAEKMEDDDLPF